MIKTNQIKSSDKESILKGSPKYFEVVKNVELGISPIDFIALNLPPICNYSCQKCSTATDSKRAVGNAIPLNRTLRLLHEARELGAKALAISGEGEPLLIKSLDTIIEEAHKLGYITVMATNGSQITKEKLSFFKEHNVTLTISLDTLNKEKYELQCSGGNFDQVLKKIELCKEIYKETIEDFGDYKIHRASIHSIINSENLDEIEAFKKNCGDDMFFSLGYIASVGNARDTKLLEDYETIKRKAEETTEFFLKCDNSEGKPVCGFFYYGIAVGYNGEILLDAHALETEGLIGNIKDKDLNEFVPSVKSLISKFYETGSCFCPVRDQQYTKFVERCKHAKR